MKRYIVISDMGYPIVPHLNKVNDIAIFMSLKEANKIAKTLDNAKIIDLDNFIPVKDEDSKS